MYHKCTLCAHACGVDRTRGVVGRCKSTDKIKIARAALHPWEEPPITGKNGSGTIFFSGCSLGCIYCQNYRISRGDVGREITRDELVRTMLSLEEAGATNINFVTPTHFVPDLLYAIPEARRLGLSLPIVYNTSSYERLQTLRALEGLVDIYLPDLMGAEYIKGLVSALEGKPLDEKRMRFHLMDENAVYEDEHIRITPFPTKHIDLGLRPSFAYLVEAEGKKVIFTGDLSGGLKGDDFPQYALDHKIDLMILEMAHFTPEMAHPWLARCRAERILLNHVNRWNEKGPGVLALNGRFGYPIRMAAEGEEIIL